MTDQDKWLDVRKPTLWERMTDWFEGKKPDINIMRQMERAIADEMHAKPTYQITIVVIDTYVVNIVAANEEEAEALARQDVVDAELDPDEHDVEVTNIIMMGELGV